MCSCRKKGPYVHVSCTGMFAPSSIPPQGEGGGGTAQLNCSTVADIIQRSLATTPEPSSRPASARPPPHLQPIIISLQKLGTVDPELPPTPRMSFSTSSRCCWEWGVNKTMCGLMMEWFEGCVLQAASLFTGRINQNYGL